MRFGFTEEQDELRAAVRDFLKGSSSESEVRRLMDTADGYDPKVWAAMASMGLLGLAIPEDLDGAGEGFVTVSIVLEEAGASLLCAPYFSTVVLASSLLQLGADPALAGPYLRSIADGSLMATVALAEPGCNWDPRGITTTASQTDGRWNLTGDKSYVVDGCTAGLVLVVARSPAGLSVFAVDGEAEGLHRTPMDTLDLTRKLAALELKEVHATLLGEEGAAGPAVATLLDLAAVGLSAEQVGGAQRALDTAVSYAQVRHQFGRPIGSFQAIKHKLADMLVMVESARSASQYACWAAENSSDELPEVAALAKAHCSEAFTHVTTENIHIHGGIGFTWEHPAHLYYRRAQSSHVLFGGPGHHRALLADRLGFSATSAN